MRPFIEVGDVSFWYETDPPPKDQWVLKEVQLTVARGEYVAIMGPNGSGKSTLARLMNGLLLPKEGKVRIGGYNTDDETHLWQVRQRVGMVFQNPDNQLVATTVRDEIAFGMENLGVPREEMVRRIPEVLAQVGLEGMEEWPPHLLSGGQKQRLAIAAVLAMRPEAIVLDEATSMLDPAGRQAVLDILHRMHREGMTIIHITHSAKEAAHAERLLIMADGEVKMDGTPEEVFQDVDRLSVWRLEVPLMAELHHRLTRSGFDLPVSWTETEKWVEAVCRLISGESVSLMDKEHSRKNKP
ncbi:energy-coupling factor transporter ATP-binding protein EcfA [Polycladomyces abyssicola]|uniref:Energy-coupling factor transporter ATP-binding protein EcfA n=1 Tax=Polycladomyces abyssicola TaxID=1125966 RepID=A0A8D5UDC8_9BACL|nr:energy-coupling factor transporter ATPase [Polycladomyces abyssicola]BCU80421.1 energy-coupling factor transporter ATP-binding protein EcfA [Polycladomyces abyssicola]